MCGSPKWRAVFVGEPGIEPATRIIELLSPRELAWRLFSAHRFVPLRWGETERGVIFHGDRGSEYMGAPFCAYLAQLGFRQSANVRGPGDNAHAESFFHSLKAELTRGVQFPTEHALRRQLAQYIRYYNTVRFHSSLGYRSPIAFERCAA